MDVNKYRDLARRLIHECKHPELTHARKNVLLKLVDLIDAREGYTAYPAFETLAEYAGVSRDTAIRAVNAGKQLGLLVRAKKGGKKNGRGVSNRYAFRIKEAHDIVAGVQLCQDDTVAGVRRHSSRPAADIVAGVLPNNLSDNLIDNLIVESAPPSSSFGNDGVVAEGKKVVGEEASDRPAWTTPSLMEIEYTPELRRLYERAEEVYTPGPVPRRYWCKRKQTRAEFDAAMATRGMDMSASRRRLDATAEW
jgi:hypothetical protein